tara:strand:- start:539 stop:862 length:324 start_codon:yes stop_codon:yes gene_type:complete
MYNTISNKAFYEIIQEDMVLSECNYASISLENYSSISIDNKDLNLYASLDLLSLEFNCEMWLGDSEEKTELSDQQLNSLYSLLLNSESHESQFSYDEQEHQLTLIYS